MNIQELPTDEQANKLRDDYVEKWREWNPTYPKTDYCSGVNDGIYLLLNHLKAMSALPVKKDESDLGNYEYFKKLTEHFKKNEVQLTPEEFKTLNDSFSKRLSKTPTRLDDQQVKEEGNPDAQ